MHNSVSPSLCLQGWSQPHGPVVLNDMYLPSVSADIPSFHSVSLWTKLFTDVISSWYLLFHTVCYENSTLFEYFLNEIFNFIKMKGYPWWCSVAYGLLWQNAYIPGISIGLVWANIENWNIGTGAVSLLQHWCNTSVQRLLLQSMDSDWLVNWGYF